MSAARAQGLVVAAQRRHYMVALDHGALIECLLKGRTTQIACGDRVEVAQAPEGCVIEAVAPRATLVYRSDAFNEKLIAANATQIAGVVAPDLGVDFELVHRWMIAAEAQGCRFVVIANKRDLPAFVALRQRLASIATLGYPVVECAATEDVTPLLPFLVHQRTVLVGQSGMGKSTLVNALAPDAGARVGEVSRSLRAGKHTTSSAALYRIPALGDDGWIVDSPGLKTFGLAHVASSALEHAFVELRPYLGHCRFRDCRHDHEPGCAVTAAVDAGRVEGFRVDLLHTLKRESARP
ncbi:MAG TPA: ribosome small subunit-dependent GTPase A [Casimicrobiaceae bacterium]